jgi:hypothetical protein
VTDTVFSGFFGFFCGKPGFLGEMRYIESDGIYFCFLVLSSSDGD